jgi:hypothetical protein
VPFRYYRRRRCPSAGAALAADGKGVPHQAKTRHDRAVKHMRKGKQKKVDKSLDMTFPASDPPASTQSTGTEAPGSPSSRQAPLISKEEIEAAAGAKPPQRRAARKRQRGGGRDDSAEQAGLGRAGISEKPRRGRN